MLYYIISYYIILYYTHLLILSFIKSYFLIIFYQIYSDSFILYDTKLSYIRFRFILYYTVLTVVLMIEIKNQYSLTMIHDVYE